jgi:hypothetical protein
VWRARDGVGMVFGVVTILGVDVIGMGMPGEGAPWLYVPGICKVPGSVMEDWN